MKKLKSFIILILALCFLAPSALLIACQNKNSSTSSSQAQTESIDDTHSEEQEESSSESYSSNTPSSSDKDSSSSAEPAPAPPTIPPAKQKAQYITCIADNVNIRSGAGTEYTVLGSAEENTMYAIIGKTGNWYKTYYKNQVAYLYASYTSVFTIEKTSEKIENVVEEGYKLLGVPYVYGAVRVHDGQGNLLSGFSTKKFDCSSLIQYIFYKGASKLLGVHTRAQVLQGTYVKPSDLQRGDCIFFTNEQRQYNKGIERVGHVALYLGDGYILHTASDYARIEKISNKRWSFYIEARRFL